MMMVITMTGDLGLSRYSMELKKNDSWFLEMNRNVELVSTEILEKLTWKLMETWLDNNNSRFLGLRQGLARD